MSYKVLALKWRPRTFEAVVGQQSTLLSLQHALNSNQVHHAYLFTGTRGIGKTTFARILAKCLNCAQGVSATPCGVCDLCVAIDNGNCVDVIEVDAASRTKVEDTRELLDNVPYTPVQARYKIYIIDEVHMLSNHSFNALLKTLEEPPPHVKFILATTDPQKLPITILSRCLQFHLRAFTKEQIAKHLALILQQESISFEAEALVAIAECAGGSMRDALSLLEQVIAFGSGNVSLHAAQQILGTSVRKQTLDLLENIINHAAQNALNIVREMAANNVDFNKVLKTLQTVIHQISLLQIVPEGLANSESDFAKLKELAAKASAFDLQLFYQTTLLGVRDLPYAADIVLGFEMIILRMIAFQPVATDSMISEPVVSTVASPVSVNSTNAASVVAKPVHNPAPAQPTLTPATTPSTQTPSENNWAQTLTKLNISGLTKVIAENCTVQNWQADKIELILSEVQKPLLNPKHVERIQEALQKYLQTNIKVTITLGENQQTTPAAQRQVENLAAQTAAESAIKADKHIQQFEQVFAATIESIDHEF